MHAQPELTALVIVTLAALACGLAMTRMKLPAEVGYILAGIALGPSGMGLVADRASVDFLADLGVLLLLFLVGMELSLRGFRSVWMIGVGVAALQIGGSVGLMLLLADFFDWSLGAALVFGFAVAISSTALAIKLLEDLNLLRTRIGQVVVAVLIAQDLGLVPMMLALRLVSGAGSNLLGIASIAAAIALLALLIWYLSRRQSVDLPLSKMLASKADLRPVYGVTLCFGAAALSGLLGLTAAYGAFVAGLVVGNSKIRRVMLRSVHPIESLLLMAFFLSIGLLVDLSFIRQHIAQVLVIVFIVTVLKTAINIGIIGLLREPWPHAFIAGLILAQIGEFTFLLGKAGRDGNLISANEHQLVIAVTALTLLVSPLWLLTARRMMRIAVLSITTLKDTWGSLRSGGFAAVWRESHEPGPNASIVLRIFGRPVRSLDARHHRRGPPAEAIPPDRPLDSSTARQGKGKAAGQGSTSPGSAR